MRIARILKSEIKFLSNSRYRFLIMAGMGRYNQMKDDEYLLRKYRAVMGKELHLDAPVTFNEKLQWLKLYDRKPVYTMMVDKYAVRQYIADTIGEEYLIPLLGVWDDPDEIDFDALPNQFVLKCNHNSGLGMCICKDKSKLNIPKVKAQLRKGLAQNYYLTGREWPYKNVSRKIIAEKYMEDASISELRDYKFFCFNGICKCMKVDFDRFINHRANYYDTKGSLLDLGETICPPDKEKKIDLPLNLGKMVKLAEKLSKDVPFLRVDFYDVNNHIYFGELTFFPASGFGTFTDEEWDYTLGSWLVLPRKG